MIKKKPAYYAVHLIPEQQEQKKNSIIYSVHCVCNHLYTPTFANILHKYFSCLWCWIHLHVSLINHRPQQAVSAQEYIILIHQFYTYSVKNI